MENTAFFIEFISLVLRECSRNSEIRYASVERVFTSIKGINSGFQRRTVVVYVKIMMGTRLKLFF